MTAPERKGVKAAAKSACKAFARNVLGLDINRARLRPSARSNFQVDVKWMGRFMHFERLLEQVADVDGAIVECGVGSGRSLFDLLLISNATGRTRRILGYDTFTGIPDATAVDGEWNADIAGHWNFSQKQVRDNLLAAGLDVESVSNIDLIQGELRGTLSSYDAGPIALLHLDVDIYESYRAALELLYDHVAPGGAITFDEYRMERWPGATKAIDEFFEDRPERVVRSPIAERFYTVKFSQ